MRDVAIVATAQAAGRLNTTLTSVELMLPVIHEVIARAGIDKSEIGFWCHGSCDYMSGQPFSFVAAVDALGAWPPIIESHVEADGAFALYEAWVKIQTGETDVALVFSNGKTTAGDIERIMALQMDPYSVAPLWPDMVSMAALQARACLDAGVVTEETMAEVAARSLRSAIGNPAAVAHGEHTVAELLARPLTHHPLRAHDCGIASDGANAVILAAGDAARRITARPAWIRGIDHRIDAQRLGGATMTASPSTAIAAEKAGVGNDKVDVAELHAPFTHQEILLRTAMGLGDTTSINPSGGALCANPQMAAGLARFAEVADRIMAGTADRGVAHCTSGPLLQQNLVCVMEGE
jgi:acetyl-CoA acetyltransferase